MNHVFFPTNTFTRFNFPIKFKTQFIVLSFSLKGRMGNHTFSNRGVIIYALCIQAGYRRFVFEERIYCGIFFISQIEKTDKQE